MMVSASRTMREPPALTAEGVVGAVFAVLHARLLDPNVLDTPAEALACAMRETLNLGDKVADMLRHLLAREFPEQDGAPS